MADELTYDVDFDIWEKEPPDPDAGGYEPYLWERVFFNGFLLKYGTITGAAEAAGVTKADIEQRLIDSPVFAARMDECRDYLRDMVRQEVFRRAVEPNEVPIYQRGVLVGKRLEWDNKHLQWVAERLMPEEFHLPSRIEGATDGSLDFKLEIGPGSGEDEE